MELVSGVIRYLIVLVCSTFSIVVFYETLLGKAIHRKRLIGYLMGKGIIWGGCVEYVMSFFYEEELWYQIVKNTGAMLLAIISYIVVYYCFNCTFLKVLISTFIAEALGIFVTYGGMVIVSFLVKRELSEILTGMLYIGDLMFVFWFGVWVFIIWKFFGKVLTKYQEYELKHQRIWWTLAVLYYLFVFYSILYDSIRTLEHVYRFAFVVMCVLGIPGIVFLLILLFWRKKSLRSEKEYLDVQKRLMQEHMELLVEQESIVRHRQKETEEQMKRLEYLQDESKEREEIKQYLHELKEQYKDLTVYQYCDDMALNAILNYRLKEILEQNVDVHVSIATEATDELRKQMWTVLGEVADEVQRVETKELEIKVFEAKGQCWIQYIINNKQKMKVL